ncbi:nitroreductase family protein [Salinicola acroporae]|uniref:Putative NAD(P)H nitroreductase n=1 Tax=Salinicola acroporae TaxID=1541440 RepID=A0ABT6I4R6_9GAMM|nr:nitroreductase family protein [Salinicola acroporae]MDH4572687.1 nitroreductase [Salinicola acroporae]
MDAMTLLHQRRSMGKLAGPAPTTEQLDALYRAALRAPDHKEMTPYRFIEISGEGLDRLGELFARSDYQANPHIDDGSLDAARKKPKRAPMIIAVIARITPDLPKVPPVEQIISAGCAAHAMLYAAFAQGLGAMWRTGTYAHDKSVWRGLGLGENEELIGYLYLGQVGGRYPEAPARDPEAYLERWR